MSVPGPPREADTHFSSENKFSRTEKSTAKRFLFALSGQDSEFEDKVLSTDEGIQIAKEFVFSKYENHVCVILFGSFARGDQKILSDIDILVLLPIVESVTHESHAFHGQPIELFVFDVPTLQIAITRQVAGGSPKLLHSLSHGLAISDPGLVANDLINEARKLLNTTKLPNSEIELLKFRRSATALVSEIFSNANTSEAINVAMELHTKILQYRAREVTGWNDSGKWVSRAISELDGEFLIEAEKKFECLVNHGDRITYLNWVLDILDRYGGPYWAGFSAKISFHSPGIVSQTDPISTQLEAPRPPLPLFRPESLEAATELRYGRPISLFPPRWRHLTRLCGALAIAALIFLATATFARKETAVGVLKLSKGELRVVPPRSGVVKALYVGDGETVAEGARLVLISTEQQLVGGGVVDARLEAAIDQEQAMLEIQLEALDASVPLEQQAMAERLHGLRNQISQLQTEFGGRAQHLKIAQKAVEEGDDAFQRGILSGDAHRQRQYDFLGQQQAQSDFNAQIAQLEGQAAETAASLAKLPSDKAQTRAQIQGQIVALEEKRANANAQNNYVLTATVAGTVTAFQAALGQPADPGKPLMTVAPVDSVLIAEVYVPSRAIGFIKPGEKVRLLYDAFPHERFGPAAGTVVAISTTVLKADEVTDAVTVKEPVYRVLVQPEKRTISAYGGELPLISGMALTADIVLEERSFLDLLFDPLRAARGRIFADPNE